MEESILWGLLNALLLAERDHEKNFFFTAFRMFYGFSDMAVVLLNNKQARGAVGEQTPCFHSHWGSSMNQSGRTAGGPVWTLKADAFKIETMPCHSMRFFIYNRSVFFFLAIIISPLGLSLSLTLLLCVSHPGCCFTSICLLLLGYFLVGARTVCAWWSSVFCRRLGQSAGRCVTVPKADRCV